MDLTVLEKKATSKVLLDIVNADGRVTVGETAYFEQLREVLNISIEEIEEAKYMSATAAFSIIRDMLPDEKSALVIMMLEMIRADGDIDDDEMKIFIVVCAACDIPLPKLN